MSARTVEEAERREADSVRSEIRAFLRLSEGSAVAARVEQAGAPPHERGPGGDEGYLRRSISYSTAGGETIDAYLFEPTGAERRGAVVVLHQHNSEWTLGKSEVAGLAGDPLQAWGPALARRGLTVLAPDAVGFESRQGKPGEGGYLPPPITKPRSSAEGWLQYFNQAMHRLVRGELLMTKVLNDAAAAVTVLAEVSGAERIGVAGHSYGGNIALFAAALDPRVAFACASGAACSYRHKIESGTGLEMALVIPDFAARFDFDDLMSCIAPRPLMVVSADGDPYSADAGDLVAAVRPRYASSGRTDDLVHLHRGVGHALDPARFDAIIEWLVARGSP